MNLRQTLRLLLRHTRAELRGGIKGFRLFLICIVLGVAAFSTILATVEVLLRSLDSNAALILGGDVELRKIHTGLDSRELAIFAQQTKALSHISLLRSMARGVSEQQPSLLVRLKAVDKRHPLLGGLFLQSGREPSPAELATLLEKRNGAWGAIVAPNFLAEGGATLRTQFLGTQFLGTQFLGTQFLLGKETFEIRAVIEQESDLASSSFPIGARVLISQAGLDATGLRVPGSLIYEHYRMLLLDGDSIDAFRSRIEEIFTEAAWSIEDRRNAAPRVRQIIDRLSLFMTFAALAGLFAGGAGIANGLTCLLRARRKDIALWKTLGAPPRYIRLLLGLQIGAMAIIGIATGCALGISASMLLAPWVGERFSLPVDLFFPSLALLRSVGVGVCVLVLFAMLPFFEIERVSPSTLLHSNLANRLSGNLAGNSGRGRGWMGGLGMRSRRELAWLLALGIPVLLLLSGLMVIGSSSPIFTLSMLAGLLLSLWIFPLASRGMLFFARWARARHRANAKIPLRRMPLLDYALQQTRAGALLSIVLPLGLGLSLFIALAEIELSLTQDAEMGLAAEAPRQFFIDLQPWQLDEFRAKVEALGDTVSLQEAPMLRGRILGFNGIKADALQVPEDYEWVLEGDRGISFSATAPANSVLTAGSWWDENYKAGELLVSMDSDVARAFGLEVGDVVKVGVLDKVLEAKIANLRDIDWRSWQINFMMVFSPHPLLEALPFTVLAAAFSTDGLEGEVDAVVARDFPNVTILRIGDFIRLIKSLLEGMTHALRAVSALTLAVGVVVLASVIVVEQQRRVYEAVVMKTLGIPRRQILLSFFLEYLLVGSSVVVLSVVLGGVFGWAILRFAMDANQVVFSLGSSLAIVAAVLLLSLACSAVSGLMVLSRSSWSVLRNP